MDSRPLQESLLVSSSDVESQVKGTSDDAPHFPTDGYSKTQLFFRWNIYTRKEFITESSWLSSEHFLLWKTFAWLWTTSIYLFTIQRFGKVFPIFLTNWNHTSIFLFFNCSFYICLRNYLARRSNNTEYQPYPTLLRFTYWIMQHSWAWTVLVVIVYWTTEFPHWVKTDPTGVDKFTNACIHAVTFVLITTDLLLNRVEFVWPHVIYTIAVSILYLIVNGIYCAVAHSFIYQILKWNGFMTVVAIIGCSLFILGMYGLGHLICDWRDRKSGHTPPEGNLPWCKLRR